MKMTGGTAAWLLVCMAMSCRAFGEDKVEQTASDEAIIFKRSLVSMGTNARLETFLCRARRGEKLTVGVIGGSITAGACASTPEKRWGESVHAWLCKTFPKTEFAFINAGIGATGSTIGAHRVMNDLLRHKPDLVMVEFGVNDGNDRNHAETFEGLIRQVLRQTGQPAAMLLFTMHRNGVNAQEWQTKIGFHYGLPMASFRDGVWPEIEAGRMKWEDVEADEVHPNDRGHRYCADFLIQILGKTLSGLPPDGQIAKPSAMPHPLISDVFERAGMFAGENLKPIVNEGWSSGDAWPFGKCLNAEKLGSRLEFEIEGTAVSVAYHRIKGPMGIAIARVDDDPPVDLNAWFEADWGGYSHWAMVARDLPYGKHRLIIELTDRKAPESAGTKFQLHAVFVAGTEQR
ncbi:MAG TPA: SGNH/GDSL hydrolase family protein [Candidatus Brocadiia bacterium]|nr:SGNH/GDSL hydrolase family protein [Candidatus Brocadiia bacterium]